MSAAVLESPPRLRRDRPALRVAIAGGGVTGLAAAVALEAQAARHGGVPVEITMLEANGRLGGKVQTDRMGRLLLERGPDALFVRSPSVLQMLDRFGISRNLVTPDPGHRQSYVLRDGRLHPLPDGMQSGVPRSLRPLATTRLLSARGKLRAAAEVLLPPGEADADESVDAFVRRRFGAEVAERIAAPLLGGIHSTDIRCLSLMASAPYLRQTEQQYGSFLRAALAQHRPGASAAARPSPFVSLASGLDSLPRLMRSRLFTTRIRVQTPLIGVQHLGREGLQLSLPDREELIVDRLILAVPAPVVARLVEPSVPEVADHLAHVRYASVIVVALVYPPGTRGKVPQGSGFVVAPDQARLLAACSWSSNKWPHCAPDGELLLRCHLHIDHQPELLSASSSGIVAMVLDELRQTIGLTDVPDVARVFRWPESIPSYTVGHLERMAEVDRLLAGQLPGVVLAGAAYRGVGIPECIRQGEEAAARILSSVAV